LKGVDDKAVTSSDRGKNLIILGMHRSGTSMVSGALVRSGFHAGIENELLSAAEDNPLGFWERRDVVALNDKLLSAVKSTWFQPAPVAKQEVAEIRRLLEDLRSHNPWLLKDPRLIFTWAAWASALKTAAKLYVYRSPLAVATSLSKRHGFPLEYGLDLWEIYNRQAMKIMQAEGGALIHYEAFSYEPKSAWEELQKRLGAIGVSIALADTEVDYDQQLDHSQAVRVDENRLTAEQRRLHEIFLQACESGQLPKRLPAQGSNITQRIQEFGQAFIELADVAELRSALKTVTSERDLARENFNKVRQEYDALTAERLDLLEAVRNNNANLVAAGRELAESLQAQETARHELDLRDQQLAKSLDTERQLNAKTEYLFYILNTTYLKLLVYRKKPAGRLSAMVVLLYKLVTLRARSRTDFESVLNDANEHVREYKFPSLPAVRSRTSLGFSVISYLIRNPASSIRSASWSRFKRAISVFRGTSHDDLQLWIQQRFPAIDDSGMPEVKPRLEPQLDNLELTFHRPDIPRVSIVIPAYNEYRMTVFCLQSLLNTTTGVDYEVIFADDASTDLTSTIGERIKGIEIVRADENQGFVNNCRNGASHARGEYLLFLNNDTAFTDGWLSNLVAVLDADPKVGIVGPMLLFGNGRLQEAGGIIWNDASGWNYGRMDDPGRPEYNYLKETDYVSGACLLIRQALWEELGGFDQRYVPAYYEDTDLCFSVRAAGYKVLYQPASKIYHFEGISNGTDLSSGVKKYQVENRGKFLAKWATTLQLENFPNAQRVFLARDKSRDRRTVLVIDHYVPSYDKDAGSRSTWQYLHLMVEMGYNVKFIGANFFPHQPYTRELQSLGVEVLVGEKMARNFSTWLNENAVYIDAVYLHRPHIAEQFSRVLKEMNPKPKLIYFGHDLHFLRVKREYELTGDHKFRVLADDWKRRELAVFKDFDKIYYASQVEVDLLGEIAPNVDVSAIPLYVLEASEAKPYCWQDRDDILFVGGFNHSPNVDAICWFVQDILPLVVAVCPDIKLNVVGSNAPDAVKALASQHVVIHGYLSDEELAAQYERARMVVVPLRYGAGVKGKILEALQHGAPLVTTDVGAEGLPEPSVVFNIKETAGDFAQELIAIERGCSERLLKLEHYAEYLDRYFSKSRASEILCRDFGEPRINRNWL
jgi:GT2 family glycosyltransferase